MRRQRRTKSMRLCPEMLESRCLLSADLALTEFMASNSDTLLDADADASDWIEIQNRSDQPAQLLGWSLTDDPTNLNKWRFPYAVLDPQAYMVIFASSKNRAPGPAPLSGDFNATPDATFAVDLPAGSYRVHLTMGDADRVRDEMAIHVQGEQKETVSLAAGESVVRSYATDVSVATNGQLAVRMVDMGGKTGRAALNALIITSSEGGEARYFDFGTTDSPVESGFTRITPTDTYSRVSGFGWLPGATLSGQDREIGSVESHTDFSLKADSETVALVAPGGEIVSQYGPNGHDYPPQFSGISYGQADSGFGYFAVPSPGGPNGQAIAGVAADVTFSAERGIYTSPIQVELTTTTEDASIRYTTDGSEPTAEAGMIYTGPIPIRATAIVRAAAFRGDLLTSSVVTNTYLYLEDVVQQDVFDPTIMESAVWGPRVDEALRALPTVSLVISDPLTINEQPVSMEFIRPDGAPGFQIDAGIERFGGHSLNSPKTNVRISFRGQYGSSSLDYPLFDDRDAAETFDQILLRSGSHDNFFWTHPGGARGNYLRGRWAFDRQLEMGQLAPHGRFVHVYLNGVYWGQYNLMERPDAEFMASYLGGEPEDYDALNAGRPVDGNRTAWGRTFTSIRDYEQLQQYLDVVNYADYMLLQFYVGNDWDWNHEQNWMAARERTEGAGFVFFAWDSDVILRTTADANVIDRGGPGNLWNVKEGVKQHEEFLILLADRAQKYFFRDGMFTDERLRGDFDALADEVRLSIIAETARWGNPDNAINSDEFYTPETWQDNIDWIKETYAPANGPSRAETVIAEMREAGVFPPFDAPMFHVNGAPQYGGLVAPEDALTFAAPVGVVYYTLDGSDPRLPGGDLSPSARRADGPLDLSANTTVRARVLFEDIWSALSEADFLLATSPLRISEIMYNPAPDPEDPAPDNDDFEFIELVNTSAATSIELEGIAFTRGIEFTFPRMRLGAGQRVVVVRDLAAFQQRYRTEILVAGEYADFKLGNGGETLRIESAAGGLIQELTYDDAWHRTTDGAGFSLEVLDVTDTDPAHFSRADAYLPSIAIGGTPGADRASAPIMPGDMNLDGVVDSDDVADFTFGLTDPAAYRARFGVPASLAGDTDRDGDLDYDDIGLFTTAVDSRATTMSANQAVAMQNDVTRQRTKRVDRFFQRIGQLARPRGERLTIAAGLPKLSSSFALLLPRRGTR